MHISRSDVAFEKSSSWSNLHSCSTSLSFLLSFSFSLCRICNSLSSFINFIMSVCFNYPLPFSHSLTVSPDYSLSLFVVFSFSQSLSSHPVTFSCTIFFSPLALYVFLYLFLSSIMSMSVR